MRWRTTYAFKGDAQGQRLERRPRRMGAKKTKEGAQGSSRHSRKKVAGEGVVRII